LCQFRSISTLVTSVSVSLPDQVQSQYRAP
jgi:hypothetical protein